MRKVAVSAILVGFGLVGTTLIPNAKADEWDKTTVITINEPVEIPGVVLPAGSYVFKLLESPSDRNIVQIFNKDQTKLFATVLAVPDYRMQPTGKTVVTFEERAKGSPEAIKAWFYPGDNYGQEFVYPTPRAMELAQATKQPVLSMPASVAQNITKPIKSPTEAPAVAMKTAPVKAITPEQKEVEMAQVVQPKPPAPMTKLPQTASDLPLVALSGVLALALGIGLGVLSKRIAC